MGSKEVKKNVYVRGAQRKSLKSLRLSIVGSVR